jgi:septum formation protein
MLLSLSGREHAVLSGIALAGPHGVVTATDRAVVRFRSFDRATAERYVATGEPMDKAGAYGIQGLGAALVESIEGDYYTVVGFPVQAFLGLVERAGWRYDFGRLTALPPA